ncbi:MAG: hypothetical protein Hyperionvirus12_50 [Hyperionvirus sp.]|uniref:Sulfotransferase domain-containing protein n=1 Tax=Hyperionvirus sp. TaxID=2487770 RepID=A0A3G5AD80_9VIRU|nr:MAG: hypothetical protein Hyperionvirus12_50 [Hyperionvirus sp.]
MILYIVFGVVLVLGYKLMRGKKESEKICGKRVILLSGARMNATVILRCFGQIPGAVIYKRSDKCGEHMEKIRGMISIGNNHCGDIFFHEEAGNISLEELLVLRESGFVIVLVLRDPRKQFLSVRGLVEDGVVRKEVLFLGWNNIAKYYDSGLIDHVIESGKFLGEKWYRNELFERLGFSYEASMANNMVRFHGAGDAMFLHRDMSEDVVIDDLDDEEKGILIEAIKIYVSVRI